MTVGLARKQGFAVNESLAEEDRSAVQSRLAKNREAIRCGGGVTDDLIPAYALAGLAAEGQGPNALTDALVHYLVLKQHRTAPGRRQFTGRRKMPATSPSRLSRFAA